jgi:hypothetical protein
MVYLHGLTYVLGRACKTSDLHLDRISTLELLAKGADGYHKAENGLIDSAVTVARECLRQSCVPSAEVDMVLFGSNSLNASDAAQDIGHRLVFILNLSHAHAQFIGFQNCGDSVPLLRTAQAMVRSGLAKNVLVVVSDDTDAANLPRVVGTNSYLHSDGASACLVSAKPGQFELLDSAVRHIDTDTGSDFDPMDLEMHLQTLLLQAKALLTQSGSFDFADERALIITHNMNRLFGIRVSQVIGVPVNRVYARASLGHCMASDALINLALITTENSVTPGSTCAIVVPNRRSIGIFTLRFTGSKKPAKSPCALPLETNYTQGIRESMLALPRWLQPTISSMTGKSLKGQTSRVLSPAMYLLFTMLWLSLCLILSAISLSELGEQAWAWKVALGLPVLWLGAVGQMRKLQVQIGHHCVHQVFFRNRPWLNKELLELISSLLLVQSANEYRREHLGHHSRALFTTSQDADAALLLQLGFRPGLSVTAYWRLLWLTLVSPRFHATFLSARMRSALGKQRPLAWRIATGLWVTILVIGLPALIGVAPTLLAIWMPLTVLYQCSALLQFLTEHAWLISEKAPQGQFDYARRCWGRFLGERCPEPGLSLMHRTYAWSRWWVRMLFVHASVRMSCLVGDLPAHDWHHLCSYLGGDHTRWMHALNDRQAVIDARPQHPLARQMEQQELWGLVNMLNHVFHLLSVAQTGNIPVPAPLPAVDASTAQQEFSQVPPPLQENIHHEKSEFHPIA